jgi:two-component system cell cycle response regulator DivK
MLLEGKRVFVIEDNPGNLAVMQTILSQHGASVYFERWGHDTCRQLLAAAPIDIILLDLMLPKGVSGYDVFEAIQAEPELARIPVVMVSAADPDHEMEKARQKGFSGFIGKPIRLNTFGHYVASVIGGERVWAPVG